ncbi:3',5'-cyclic AMP phosphodiesterase CpdA [Roseospira marina]|nr:3',5'-cyclic AMP phosphodiesterase CpdA [Roseospira marina]MBB5088998.1 3',5'-cyclic AMP phosphodiesterase CpdA [Roseospira marina]
MPLRPDDAAGVRWLGVKRRLGRLSWRLKRQRIHQPAVLAALLADVAAQAPDHIVLTGDLTNLALPDEVQRARAWLDRIGPPDRVSVVPGNHDAMVAVPWTDGLGRWAPWLTGDTPEPDAFPFVRMRGPVAFVGVSTAAPSLPLLATGRIGAEQAARLEAILADLGRRDRFRVVLIHHPPLRVGESERRALRDRPRVQNALARVGAELVLHGHHHRDHIGSLPGPNGPVPVIGVSSASAAPVAGATPARWVHYTVTRPAGGGWRLSAVVRGYTPDGFRTDARFAVTTEAHHTAP